MKTIGLISGAGNLPRIIAEDAKRRGYKVVAIALEPVADPKKLEPVADVVEKISVGKLGKILDALKKHGVREAVMAGKVSKEIIYSGRVTPDMRALRLLWRIKDRNDDTILLALTEELESEGIKLLETTGFCSDMLTPKGVLTKKEPSKSEWKDIEYGFRLAKEIGRLDIGQTVVVKEQAVMAVEAIEGTDKAIKRGGKLAQDVVVVKVAKPGQDLRFDVPVAGMSTIDAMIGVEARVLALEAGRTILLERKKAVKEAEQAGITIVGYTPRRP